MLEEWYQEAKDMAFSQSRAMDRYNRGQVVKDVARKKTRDTPPIFSQTQNLLPLIPSLTMALHMKVETKKKLREPRLTGMN
jgi:hypothetical protein